MKNQITVEHIKSTSLQGVLQVHFSNGAMMEVTNTDLTPIDNTVYTNEKCLRSDRLTKKYIQALNNYIELSKVEVITHTENEQKIEYKVYQVGKKITAFKIDMVTGEKLCSYDWSHYEDIQNAIMDMSHSNNWHYRYTFYVISKDLEVATARAIVSDIQRHINFDLAPSDINNLVDTLKMATRSGSMTIEAFIVDSEKSIHIVRKVAENDYSTHSIFNNGIGDRTTYHGMHRGKYNFKQYSDADFDIRKRSQGGHIYRQLSF